MRRRLSGFPLLLLLIGCQTQSEPVTTELPEAIRREIVSHIQSGAPEQAVQRISAVRREELLSPSELDLYFDDAVQEISKAFHTAVAERRYLDAIRHYRNLEVLGVAPDGGLTVNRLYGLAAESYYQEGNLPAAVATLLQAPELSELPPEAIEELANTSLALNNRQAAAVAAEVLGPQWRTDNPEIVRFPETTEPPVNMVDGTVTVWVNRGIRLEAGIGYADRVIGSGFFVDPRGYIITNHHVISSEVDPEYEGYSRLYVRLPSAPETRIPARVIGYDRIFDIALLKVEIDAPYVFSLTNIRALEPGSRIIAIGSPGGLENSISSGIISATSRRFLQLGDAMQVDVPINPGNSGGPLLDERGSLVGIVFAGIEQFEGVNFAIPSFWIHPFLSRLYDGGEVTHPWIGVAVQQVAGTAGEAAGLQVIYVAQDSPAEAIGIGVGDVITKIGEWDVEKIGSAQRVLLSYEAGSLIEVTWRRSDVGDATEATVTATVALDERPFSPVEEALERDLPERVYPVLFGMSVERAGLTMLGRQYSVSRVYPGLVADETGITPGDTFTDRGFEVDEEYRIAYLRILVRKRTEGFMETGIQLPAYIETDTFL